MKWWLKVICVLALAYSTVCSFWYPMGPGGLEVSATKFKPGNNEFVFTGYNTHFQSERSSLQVFVANDSSAIYKAKILEVGGEDKVRVSVFLPDTISSKQFEFYANTDKDGTIKVESPIGSEGFTIVPGANVLGTKVSVKNKNKQHFAYPYQPIIIETIRNLMWHVPMWFTMFVVMTISFISSLKALNRKNDIAASGIAINIPDLKASSSAAVGLFFCTLGLITGSVWARFAWGAWWTNDPQLNGAMVVFLMYVAYFILRQSVADEEKKARLSAIFNIFAFVLMVVLLMVMPRFAEGLHPGKSGNPAFSQYDLDSSLRAVFYPACLGFILLGYWLYNVNYRINKLELENEEIS
jgi:heme exporter protein C